MPLSVHDEFRKPPMRSRSTKSSASGLAYSSTRLSINEIGVSVRAEYSHQKMPLNPANSGCFDDVAAPLALNLWRNLPTPRAGQRVREATLARVLKQHRIRRIAAATLRDRLRAPAVKVAPGAAEAAAAHVRLVVKRLVLVNRQIDDARHHLDRLVRQLAEPASADDPDVSAEAEPGVSKVPPDAAVLL